MNNLDLAETHQQLEQLLRAKQYQTAIRQAEQALVLFPDDPHLLYLGAVAARYDRQFDIAQQLIDQLLSKDPSFGRAYQEKAHQLRDQDQLDSAYHFYQLAVRHNNALVAAWTEMTRAEQRRGDLVAAQISQQQVNYLSSLVKPLQVALDHCNEGRYVKAEKLCRLVLSKQPKNIEAMRLLAEIGIKLGAMDDAETLLEHAATWAPENLRVRTEYVQLLRKRQKYEAALAESNKLHQAFPDNSQCQAIYAIELMQVSRYDEAIAMFNIILLKQPNDPITLVSKAHALKTKGQQAEAVACYRQAIEAKPEHGEAWYSLANLKMIDFSDDEVAQMKELMTKRQELAGIDQTYLSFALGKAMEDREAFSESFNYYSQGCELKKQQSNYRGDAITDEVDRQIANIDFKFANTSTQLGAQANDPIFIVGLPRAGSTLLEQILASHSQVDGTLELPNILALVHQLRRGTDQNPAGNYPECIKDLSADELRAFGQAYIDDTQVHREDAPFFIDKMPNNFRHIGLIKSILPNAKIIDARRHPMACCFSGFKQLFAEGQEFSYSLADIGHYYADYIRLMDHWHSIYPGEILTVNYEDVVDDLAGQVQSILNYCELPFEATCIDFHSNQRSVRTASSEQVRKPIYRQGVDQWRNFEPWLGELKNALGRAYLD
ncbi:tetratricopeptide repeat-containing sulfotransferase family protein [uncultured Umboniibacter sp.]|uniref:sulfotransferase n=1 Tax=uncultured Umboniibacter sp. TaxID=1798917 RepID=UPI002612DFB5|nr:tetratricopeptide repeat-containing sulfotransferase family protein [uncultured Umboniibacter sp.]